MKNLLITVFLIANAVMANTAFANITLSKCLIQANTKGSNDTKAYVRITSTFEDTLKSVKTDLGNAKLYETKVINGARVYSEISSFPIRSNGNPLSIGGTYIGLSGLKGNLISGQTYKLTLFFEKAGEISCDARVKKAGAILKQKYRATPKTKQKDEDSIIDNIFNFIF